MGRCLLTVVILLAVVIVGYFALVSPANAVETRVALVIGNSGYSDDGAHRIYLASYRGIQKADEGWRGIVEANIDLLGGLDAAVAQIDLGRDKGSGYRLQAGPRPDLTDANALGYKLSQRSSPCIALAP